MEESDSENEGQLLIDESVDTSKRSRATRKRGPVAKKPAPKKTKSLKIVVKAPAATPNQRGKKPKAEIEKTKNFETNTSTNVRVSARVRKRARRRSPSPVRTKKEPPKKKLKIKIKNVSKFPKKKKSSSPPTETVVEMVHKTPTKDETSQAMENVDIESVSDEELLDIQYSSVIVDEDLTEKIKKSSKLKKKAGIKLKLSLGKVLTPKITESFDNEEKTEEALPSTEISSPTTPKEDNHVVKPLIISKRRVSSEMDPNSKSQVSIIPTGNESPYYSSSSEDHKPLTLRLSVGRPKIPKRSISEFENSNQNLQRSCLSIGKPKIPKRSISEFENPNQTYPKPFHNLKRSWSVAPSNHFEPEPKVALKVETSCLSVGIPKIPKCSISEFENPNQTYPKPFHNLKRSWSVAPSNNFEPELKVALKVESNMPKWEQPTERLSTPSQNVISGTYCNMGLQSLLDVVSVEINEQKANSYAPSTNILPENIVNHSSPPKSHLLSTTIPTPNLLKSPSLEKLPHSHEGHLPSMAFPKPPLHFSSKKRPRIKSVTNASQLLNQTSDSEDVVEVKGHEKQKGEVESSDDSLTDKERRRRDKKKTLNDDFVDPDSVVQGGEIEVKRLAKKPSPLYITKAKAGGLSLLMPQMKSHPTASEPKTLQMGGNCSLSNKNVVSRKPKKGMATAKQRLANKLKIGRSFSR